MTNMIKLSEAIRNGAEGREQCKDAYFVLQNGRRVTIAREATSIAINAPQSVVACCALGAATLGGVDLRIMVANPCIARIIHDNDVWHMSIEDIIKDIDPHDFEAPSWL